MSNSVGRLEIYIGPMYSQKSSTLISLYHRYRILDKNILVINHSADTRYGKNEIHTHNHYTIQATPMAKLIPFQDNKNSEYADLDTIMIEEAQFFPDLFEFVTTAVDFHNKTVFLFGLSGDFQRQKFGQILDLIPHAEKVVKLEALCKQCNNGNAAHFSKRIINSDQQTLVGANESYVAVCRYHYLN